MKKNVLCVETVVVCTCKFGICETKDQGIQFPKKLDMTLKSIVCCLCFVNED